MHILPKRKAKRHIFQKLMITSFVKRCLPSPLCERSHRISCYDTAMGALLDGQRTRKDWEDTQGRTQEWMYGTLRNDYHALRIARRPCHQSARPYPHLMNIHRSRHWILFLLSLPHLTAPQSKACHDAYQSSIDYPLQPHRERPPT